MEFYKEKTVYNGLTFLDALTLIFIVLKLTHVIDWSWWWVLSPIWLMIIYVVLILVYILYKLRRISK